MVNIELWLTNWVLMPNLKSHIIALKVLRHKTCQNFSDVFSTQYYAKQSKVVMTLYKLTIPWPSVSVIKCSWWIWPSVHDTQRPPWPFSLIFFFFFVCHKLDLRLKSILCLKLHALFVVKFTSALKFDVIHWSMPPPDGSGNQRWPMSCCSRDLAVFCLACKLLTCPLLNDRARMHETLLCIVFLSHA